MKVRGLAESLFSASDVARTGADDLAWAKRRVLDAVNEAEEAGFAVSEDLSVRYRGWMIGTDAEIAARQALAEEFAYEIQSRAAVLMAMDHEVAAKITAAVAPLGEVSFEETESSGSVHAVDYRRTPVHTDNPDGEEDPFVPGGHTHEPQPAQSGPIPFDPETGAAEEAPLTAEGENASPSTLEAPYPAPRVISGMTQHGEEQVHSRDGHGVSDTALRDAVEQPMQPPTYVPDSYGGTYRYLGKDSIVVLNEEGQVVTAWATGSGGWRNP